MANTKFKRDERGEIMNSTEELSQQIEHIQKLIVLQNRNLQKLEEQAAKHGLDIPLSVSNTIDETKEKLKELQVELARLKAEMEVAATPLVYLHTFGHFGESLPDQAKLIYWSDKFNREITPRKVPGPAIWDEQLWPQLRDVQREIAQRGLIRLRAMAALSAGFAFGHIFSRAGQYRLAIAQASDLWRSDEAPDERKPEFEWQEILDDPQATGVGVVVNALPGQSGENLVAAVKGYMSRQGGLKMILLLQAEMAVKRGQSLKGWEAAVLARTSQSWLRDFVNKTTPDKLHLFLATPLGLAVLLGHYWNAIGLPAQCYEWVGGDQVYAPSCLLDLS